jgi:hypothetical protein
MEISERRTLAAVREEVLDMTATMVQLQQNLNTMHARLLVAAGVTPSEAPAEDPSSSAAAAAYRISLDARSPPDVIIARIREIGELCAICMNTATAMTPGAVPLGSGREKSEAVTSVMRQVRMTSVRAGSLAGARGVCLRLFRVCVMCPVACFSVRARARACRCVHASCDVARFPVATCGTSQR